MQMANSRVLCPPLANQVQGIVSCAYSGQEQRLPSHGRNLELSPNDIASQDVVQSRLPGIPSPRQVIVKAFSNPSGV